MIKEYEIIEVILILRVIKCGAEEIWLQSNDVRNSGGGAWNGRRYVVAL